MFHDRLHAGVALATALETLAGADVIVAGVPRGGMAVAAAVARRLKAPLEAVFVERVQVPSLPFVSVGAVAEDGTVVWNPDAVKLARLGPHDQEELARRQFDAVARRALTARTGRPRLDMAGHTVLLVDDGLATGSTMEAAVRMVRKAGAARIVVGIPVAHPESVGRIRCMADHVACLTSPPDFYAIELFYEDFRPVTHGDVARILRQSAGTPAQAAAHLAGPAL